MTGVASCHREGTPGMKNRMEVDSGGRIDRRGLTGEEQSGGGVSGFRWVLAAKTEQRELSGVGRERRGRGNAHALHRGRPAQSGGGRQSRRRFGADEESANG